MTGHGDASGQNERLTVTAELRSVNNRHLKLSFRCPDSFLAFESHVEKVVRSRLSRGTITVSLHVRRLDDADTHHLDVDVLEGYWRQLQDLSSKLAAGAPQDLSALLTLPGVVASPGGLPIFADGKVIGGVGVSGVTGDQDEQCAKAGLGG